MGIFDIIAEEKEAEGRETRELSHKKFKDNFLRLINEKPKKFLGEVYQRDKLHPDECAKDKFGNITKPVSYDEKAKVVCCPEPIEFISAFNDCIDNQNQCKKIMQDLIDGKYSEQFVKFKRILLDHEPADGMWFNKTENGVNLRPGLLDEEMGQPYAITMGDLAVHAVVVGRTGSGKSVFLNNLIFNMLTEYAPWELDLYLADFKKVELSRYMSKHKTPHLKTCAATSEIRYVITMLTHLVDCMQARQDLFTRLGIQKLSEFRKKYNVVLPRVVLLIDEFQQMFQEATNRENVIINDLLMSIIKLGRATGFHLIFASQEMSGALSAKALANFKIRFALPCDSSVSADILGNSAASTLDRGFVLVNTESGKEFQNKKFKVPFIPDDEEVLKDGSIKESYFYKTLREYSEQADGYSFTKKKTFYQEDLQTDIEELENRLDNKNVKNTKDNYLADKRYFDIFTLGNGVVFSDKKYDLETFFLERGKNKNIFAICPDIDDLAYVQMLLAVNFKHSTIENAIHYFFDLNPLLSAKYHIQDDIADIYIINTQEQLSLIKKKYFTRISVMEAAKQDSVEKFIDVFYDKIIEGMNNKEKYLQAKKITLDIFSDSDISDVLTIAYNKLNDDARYIGYVEPLIKFYKYKVEKIDWFDMFPPINFWISGVEYIELFPKWIFEIMRNGMSANMLFSLFTSSDDIRFSDIFARCDYIFASGNNEKIYTKCGMKFTKKSRNSIVIDFKIKSLNTERSFKKYKIKKLKYEVPSLNFDDLL